MARFKPLSLGNLPTPLEQPLRLANKLGIDLWIKRDDMTAGPEAGNKIRKLDFLLADALDQGADTVITCGGIQSNHARATALCAARLGLATLLLLRATALDDDDDGRGIALSNQSALEGNLLLDRIAGAKVLLITRASYARRAELLAEHAARLAADGARPYVIPEGGSNGLGALGYVEAMAEIRRQLDVGAAGGAAFDLVVHACGSGGTAAGVALGARRYRVATEHRAMAVCDDQTTFERVIGRIMAEARVLDPELDEPVPWHVDDRFKGPGYAVSTPRERVTIIEAARLSGLVLDPVYTGKAFHGLSEMCASGELRGARVLFIHTGGLPGLLAQAQVFAAELG